MKKLAKNIPTYYDFPGTPIFRDTTALPFADGGKLAKRIVKKYPGMQNVYGAKGENLNIIKDPNYSAAEHGYGDIEFIHPGSGHVQYSDDYDYQSPTPDKYTAVYNPKGANKHDVFLDMMHGMRNDPEYMKLLDTFTAETKKARGKSMDHWYGVDSEKDPNLVGDGREQWDNNFIDGVLRSHLAEKGMGKHSSDVKGYKMERKDSTPEIYSAADEIYSYLKGRTKQLADGGPLHDRDINGNLLNSTYASPLGNMYREGGPFGEDQGTFDYASSVYASQPGNYFKDGGQFQGNYSLPEDSFKQGGNNLHNSVYASSPQQYPAVYNFGGTLGDNLSTRQQMYMPLDHITRTGGSILSMSNTPQMEGEGKDLVYANGGTLNNSYAGGGQIYTYAGRPGAEYQKTANGWTIRTKDTNGAFITVQDPTGKRTALLNAQAKPITTKSPYQLQQEAKAQAGQSGYDMMASNKPQVGETTQKVAQDYMMAKDLNEVAKRTQAGAVRQNLQDPGHIYKAMTDDQILDNLTPELLKAAEEAFKSKASWTNELGENVSYKSIADAGRDYLVGQAEEKVDRLNNPLVADPITGKLHDPRTAGPWNNYNDGALQSTDWMWTLPFAAPAALEGLAGLGAMSLPGMSAIPGATAGNLVNSGFIANSLYNMPKNAGEWYDVSQGNKDWTEAALGTGEIAAGLVGSGAGAKAALQEAEKLGLKNVITGKAPIKDLFKRDDLLNIKTAEDLAKFKAAQAEGKLGETTNRFYSSTSNPDVLNYAKGEEEVFVHAVPQTKAAAAGKSLANITPEGAALIARQRSIPTSAVVEEMIASGKFSGQSEETLQGLREIAANPEGYWNLNSFKNNKELQSLVESPTLVNPTEHFLPRPAAGDFKLMSVGSLATLKPKLIDTQKITNEALMGLREEGIGTHAVKHEVTANTENEHKLGGNMNFKSKGAYQKGQATGMPVNSYATGGSFNNKGFMSLPKEIQQKIRSKSFADGGQMEAQLTEFNAGGRHEENPLGGIPQGSAPDGKLNLVEQGETKLNSENYIFSDSLKVDKDTAAEFALPKADTGKTFADLSKKLNRPNSRRENDTIEQVAIKRDLDNLMNAQEAFKQKEVQKKMEEIQALDPNALAQVAQSYQPQGMPPQGMEQGMPQEQMPQGQPSPEEMMMMQQQGQGQPPMDPAMMQQMMAQQGAPEMPMQYGGPMSYKCGGGMYEYGGHLMDNHSYKGGGVVRAIGTGLSAAAPLIAKIPGYGTAIGAVAGGLGAGLGNVGTGADFKEVARDVAFGAGKAAASTIPGGGALVGAAEGIVNNNVTDASEKETAERLANDPSAAEDIAKEQRTSSLINMGVGALGSAVASTKTDDAAPAVPAAAPATPAPAMPAMPVNDAMMMPTATTTMPLPEQPINALNKYGGSMYQYGGNLSRQFYGGGAMAGSNFSDSGNYYGLNNQGLTTNGSNTQQAAGNNGLSGGQYAQMGLSAVNAGADINRINKSDMSQDAKTSAYGDTANQIGDSTVQTIFPALAPAFAAKNAYQGMLTSNVNPETGEKAYKKGFQASSNEAATPIHTRQITGVTDFVKDKSLANFGKMAWNFMEPGSAQVFDSAKGIWGKDKYAENQTAIDLNQASQAEAYNQQQLAAQQQQQNMINSAVQAGIAGYNQQPQDDINSNFAKYGGHQFSTAYPNFKNSAGPMGQPLTNLYAMGGMFDEPGDPPVTAAASTTPAGTLNPNYAAQLKAYNTTMADNKSMYNTKTPIDLTDPANRDWVNYKDPVTGLAPKAIYKSSASTGYGSGVFLDLEKPLEYLPTPATPIASTPQVGGFTSANQGIAMPERGNIDASGNPLLYNRQYSQYAEQAANAPEKIQYANRAQNVHTVDPNDPSKYITTTNQVPYSSKAPGGAWTPVEAPTNVWVNAAGERSNTQPRRTGGNLGMQDNNEFGGDLDSPTEEDMINHLTNLDINTTRSFVGGGFIRPTDAQLQAEMEPGYWDNYSYLFPKTEREGLDYQELNNLIDPRFKRNEKEVAQQMLREASTEEELVKAQKYLSDLEAADESLKDKNLNLNMNQTWAQAAGLALPAAYNIQQGLFGKVGTLNPEDYYQKADFTPYEYNDNPQRRAIENTFAGLRKDLGNIAAGQGGGYGAALQAAANSRNASLGELNAQKENTNAANALDAKVRNKAIEAANKEILSNVTDYNIKAKEAKRKTLAEGLKQAADIAKGSTEMDAQSAYMKVLAPDFAGSFNYNTIFDQISAARKASGKGKNNKTA
jgi:hypothetical protein